MRGCRSKSERLPMGVGPKSRGALIRNDSISTVKRDTNVYRFLLEG